MVNNSCETPVAYDAFISYSRQDKAFAEKLDKALDNYKPPKELPVPQRYLSVFRDESDFTGSEYHEALDRHLRASAKLIVICSPAASRSAYVDDEIRRFVDIKGAGHIVAILLSGRPNNELAPGQEVDKAFPQALCDVKAMPLAAPYRGFDVYKDRVDRGQWEGAWYNVLADLYGLRRDEVEQREKKRQARILKRRTLIVSAIIVTLSVALVITLISRHVAIEQLHVAQSRELAAHAEAQNANDPELGLALAKRAVAISHTVQAVDSLRHSLQESHVRAVLAGHRNGLDSVAYSPDGQYLLTASQDGTAGLWDVSKRRTVLTLEGHQGALTSATFSPEGALVVTASLDGTTQMWEMKTGKPLLPERLSPCQGAGGWVTVTHASFSPNGSYLITTCFDGTARLIRIEGSPERNMTMVPLLDDPMFPILSASFSPDSQYVATVGRCSLVRIWRTATGQLVKRIRKPLSPLSGLVYNPHGEYLYDPANKSVPQSWEMVNVTLEVRTKPGEEQSSNWRLLAQSEDKTTGQMVNKGEPSFFAIYSAEFSPDGKQLVTASSDNLAEIWDIETQKVVMQFRGHLDWVKSATFSRDGRFVVTASYDKTARVWDTATGRELAVLRGHTDKVTKASFSPDSLSIASSSFDGTARIWESAVGWPKAGLLALEGPGDTLFDKKLVAANFSPDGRFVVTSGVPWSAGDKTARIWETGSGRIRDAIPGYARRIGGGHGIDGFRVVFSPAGKIALFDPENKGLRIYDVTKGSTSLDLQGQANPSAAVAFSPDGTRLATVSGKSARVWNVATGLPVGEELNDHTGEIKSVAFSPDGRLIVTTAADATARVWDISRSRTISILTDADEGMDFAVFPSGSKYILTVSNGSANRENNTVRAWDWRTDPGKVLTEFKGNERDVFGVAINSDGRLIAAGSGDNTALVWNADTGALVARLAGHEDHVFSVDFSPDDRYLLTASADGTARVWELTSGKTVADLHGYADNLRSAMFSRDGKSILAATDDGMAYLYPFNLCCSIEDLMGQADHHLEWTRRQLTAQDEERYLGKPISSIMSWVLGIAR